MEIMRKMLLILNPRSGKCKGRRKLSEVLRILQCGGYYSTVMLTEASGDARRFVCEYGGDHDVVACIGGDGTFSEVASGIVAKNYDIPIGYIPAGSANDYGSSLGLSFDLCSAAYDVVNGVPQRFDIGSFNGYPFVYVAAFGVFAKVSYSAPQNLKNVLGHFAYILEGMKDLHSLHSEHVCIDIEEEHFEGDYILGIISNAITIGGILRFSGDEVSLDDGFLELLLIEMPSTPWEVSQILQALSTRVYSQSNRIIFRRSKKISIHTDSIIPWTIDGEWAESSLDIEISNVPNAIRVIVPTIAE